MNKRLAIVLTHPIQYYIRFLELLAQHVQLKVFYTWGEESISKFDPGFGKNIEWDIPLLEGYDYEFLKNIAQNPGSHHFKGIKNPHAIQRIKAFAPDAVLIYGWAYQSHLQIIRHFKGKVPVWFRGDSTLLDGRAGWKSLLRISFLKWVYSHIDKAFYVGSANKKYYKKCGLKEEQLVFAPHTIDNDRFAKDRSEEAAALRKKLKIESDAILILFAGKLEPVKNPELLLQAFCELDLPNTYLLFVGNGILEDKLKSKISLKESLEVDFKSQILFLEFQNQTQMPLVYQACDLFCLPSISETWGLAVNEAMAAGKAVLVSDKAGCAADLIKSNINGEVFQSGNKADLKNKLQELSGSKERLNSYGKSSKEIIQNWSFMRQVTAILKELGSLNEK